MQSSRRELVNDPLRDIILKSQLVFVSISAKSNLINFLELLNLFINIFVGNTN